MFHPSNEGQQQILEAMAAMAFHHLNRNQYWDVGNIHESCNRHDNAGLVANNIYYSRLAYW